MESIRILVETGELLQKAEEVSLQIETVSIAFARINQIVENTEHYWEGEAANTCRRIYTDQRDTVRETLQCMKEYRSEILKISGLTEAADNRMVNTLKDDAIY